MTAPDGGSPPGSMAVGLFRGLQTKSVDEMKSTMSGGVMGAFEHLQGTAHETYNDPLAEKPSIEQVPIDSTMWHTMSPKEQATFPRAQLVKLVRNATNSGGSGDTAHTHGIQQFATVPDYQPSGNNSDFAEIGFIRISKDCAFNKAGFITGDSATFLDVTGAYLGVYRMDPDTGDLTMLNTGTYTTNLKSAITSTNTETLVGLGGTFTAVQNEVIAVALVQDTSVVQTAASIMCARITDLNREASTARPRKAYAYAGPYTTGLLPTYLAEADQNFSASTKLPFFYLREV